MARSIDRFPWSRRRCSSVLAQTNLHFRSHCNGRLRHSTGGGFHLHSRRLQALIVAPKPFFFCSLSPNVGVGRQGTCGHLESLLDHNSTLSYSGGDFVFCLYSRVRAAIGTHCSRPAPEDYRAPQPRPATPSQYWHLGPQAIASLWSLHSSPRDHAVANS